jgi:ankyrin repeat protein
MSFKDIPLHIWAKYLPQDILSKMVVNKSTRELGILAQEKEIKEIKKLSQDEKNKLMFNRAHLPRPNYIEILLKGGADVNTENGCGHTLLQFACFHGYKEIVKFLLKWDVKFDINDTNEFSPFNLASSYGHIEIVKMFLENSKSIEE